MNKQITSIILMFCFVITLAVPTTTVQAATDYSKVNKTYKLGDIKRMSANEYTGSTDQLEKGYTNVYKFSTSVECPVYFTFLSSDNSDYDVCLTNKSGKKLFESKKASKKFNKYYKLAKGTYYIKIKANKKSLYQIRLDWSFKQTRIGKGDDFFYIVNTGDYVISKGSSIKLNPGVGSVSWKLSKAADKKYISLSTSKGKACTVNGLKTGKATIMIKYKGIYLSYGIEVVDDVSSSEFIDDIYMIYSSEYNSYSIYWISYVNNSEKTIKKIAFNLYNRDDLYDEDSSDIYRKTVTRNIVLRPYEKITEEDIDLNNCEELGDRYAVLKDVTVTYTDGTTKTMECNKEFKIGQPLHGE